MVEQIGNAHQNQAGIDPQARRKSVGRQSCGTRLDGNRGLVAKGAKTE